MLTLAGIIRRNARLFPQKPAFCFEGRSITFAEYDRRVNRLVAALADRGLGKGDRMVVMANNCPAYLDLYGGAEKGGYLIAPLNFRLTAGEASRLVHEVRPRAVFAQRRYVELLDAAASGALAVCLDAAPGGRWRSLDELLGGHPDTEPGIEVSPDDACYLIFTSGTTGSPRAAQLTHLGQWLDAAAIALELQLDPLDRHLATMPIYHIGGRALVLAHTLRGCTVHLQDGFDPGQVLAAIERERITTTQVVPTMVARLLQHPELAARDLSSLRRIWYASAPMPVGLLRRALRTFGPVFLQGYGQTEAGPLVTAMEPHEHELEGPGARRLASCGRPVPGVEVRLVDEGGAEVPAGAVGELTVRSPFLMTGYWERPEQTAESLRAGWLHTGDMGYADEDGYLYIVDRKRDVIISGGENVYPREVEEVLYTHPAVLEAAVIGVPDQEWGETVQALVVRADAARVDEAELIAFCRARLAGYKCPRSVEFREELPKSPSGKVLKRVLRDDHRRGRPRRV